MRVLVTGATGFIGSPLIEALLKHGYEVSACARDISTVTARFPEIATIKMDFTKPLEPEDWLVHLTGVDVVINTVGIIAETGAQTFNTLHIEFPRMLFKACELAGVRRIIQLSALGAEADASSHYYLSKHAADTYLRGLDLEKVIVKPSLVFGNRGQSTTFFRALAAQPVQVLMDQGEQQVQPIYIDDLIVALVKLTSAKNPPAEIAAVGPAPISFRAMLTAYRQWLGYDPDDKQQLRSISLPFPLMLTAAQSLGFLKNPFMNAANIRMLKQGNTASPATITAVLGAPPVSFKAALLKTPATDADRWHARLYFLHPLLRWVIGFVWIYTGLISAFVYPVSESYLMLRQVGLTGWMLPANLYGAALLDIALGMAVLLRYKVYLVGIIQLLVILGYTVIISIFLPEFWFHPFGPIVKNIPFVLIILIMMATERNKQERK